MDKELEKTISDKLAEFFNDPIDIECSYCEAAKAVYPIIKKAVTEEIKKGLMQHQYVSMKPGTIKLIIHNKDWKDIFGGKPSGGGIE